MNHHLRGLHKLLHFNWLLWPLERGASAEEGKPGRNSPITAIDKQNANKSLISDPLCADSRNPAPSILCGCRVKNDLPAIPSIYAGSRRRFP